MIYTIIKGPFIVSPTLLLIFVKYIFENNTCCSLPWNQNLIYINSPRIGEYRNILGHSRTNWRVIVRTDFHILYSPIFVRSANLEVSRMYLAHNDKYWVYEYTDLRITCSPILCYSPRINVCGVPA